MRLANAARSRLRFASGETKGEGSPLWRTGKTIRRGKNTMALYSYSWLILLSPLFAFAVIVFGTRMWDLFSRPKVEATVSDREKEEAVEESDIHELKARGPKGEDLTYLDIEDPKVLRFTPGAKVSGYL